MELEKRYTVKEVAQILGISENAVRIKISRGQLRGYKLNSIKQGYIYIPESNLCEYMDRLGIKYTK